ncbi:hypothetical protein Trydic_g1614 [Trypoxylus dichotomus]
MSQQPLTENRPPSWCVWIWRRHLTKSAVKAAAENDTTIVETSRHSKIAAGLVQAHLAKIEEFFCTGGLKINPRKTQAIAFTRTHQELQQKITDAKTEVEWSGQIRYLGMILDKEQGQGQSAEYPSYTLSYPTQPLIPKGA